MIRAGYKQTEIGVIPKDWVISILDQLASKVGSGITPRGGSNAYKLFGRPFVRSQNVGWGILKLGDIAFIDDKTHETFQNTEIRFKDVFLNISGASIGRSAVANRELVGGNVNQHVCILRTKREKLHPIFLNKILLSTIGQDQIDSFQSGGNREGLNIGQIKTFKIPLPPLPEQIAIATVLSDTDKLLQAIEKKIAKKRLIRQGAMQELLRPKEGWVVKSLGEILQFGSGRDYKHLNAGIYPVYGTGGIMTFVNDYLFDGESVGIGRKGTIDKPVFLQGKFWTVDTLFFTHSFKESSPKYIYYQFLLIRWRDYNEASGVPSLSKNTLEEIEIRLPDLLEQIRIASILTAMDTEIESLENQLAKYKQVKQGLMQNLLTGKIRLV